MLISTGSAETETYVFLPEQSTVVQTNFFGGIDETYSITGQFQLTINLSLNTVSFNWVDATLSESPNLYTRSLGELFFMDILVGTFVNNTTVEFELVTDDLSHEYDDIQLTLTFENDSVHLTGNYAQMMPGGSNFSLDAIAQKESGGWMYHYLDDFSTDKAETDSNIHSVFWPRGAFPPPEPYLSYYTIGDNRGLAFMDYNGQPAHLGYCFPISNAQAPRALKGSLAIDVLFPHSAELSQSPPGYLLYSTSSDGLNWSSPKPLSPGRNNIPISSPQGSWHVILLGTRVIIDNLELHLYGPSATIYVPGDFNTIQKAIDAAADGDIIEVAPGVYKGNGNWDIEFRGKAITVRSANGPEQTVIDCSGPSGSNGSGPSSGHKGNRGFYFHEAEHSDSVLCGFTIRGGKITGNEIPSDNLQWNMSPTHPIGGGIYCENSSPTIINCVVRDCGTEIGGGIGCVGSESIIVNCLVKNCTAGGFGNSRSGGRGGGIGLIRDCNVGIRNCIIKGNSGYYNSYGGGIYCRRSSVVIKDCEISFNSAPGNIEGGGIYCTGPLTRVALQNCNISNNTANAGGGIFTELGDPTGCDGCPPCRVRVTNCTIAHNKLSEPQMPPLPAGGIHSLGSDIIVKNSIVWYNEGIAVFLDDPPSNNPVVYSDIEQGYPGQGNINANPLFAFFALTAIPDYHLQSIYGRFNPANGEWVIDNYHSPCINAGDPTDPVGHEPPPNGNRINMGAYGGTNEASKGIGRYVYHVDGINGDDANNGLKHKWAFATIQKGIDSARDGDVVLVWPDVYKEEVNFDGKAIRVQSAADVAVVTASSGYAFSFFKGEGSKSVLRNFIVRNSEYGIFCNGASPTIRNLTIVDNEFGIAAYGGGDPNITNCILWNNDSGDLFQCEARYSCIEEPDHNESQGNISKKPLFADADSGDYHLQSRYGRYWPEHNVWIIDRQTSPCIDAGDPSVYPSREWIPHGGRLNMGAYGGTGYASMGQWPLKGDLNNDGLVSMKDFAMLAEDWLESLPWAPRKFLDVDIIMPVDGTVIPMPVIQQDVGASALGLGRTVPH
jgi:hypothetical protein